jgi:UDP-N-acetyl-D-galactosamine dehydrogenase
MSEKIAVIGLGYVGLPLALAFAQKFPNTIGFDINEQKVNDLKQEIDQTREVSSEELNNTNLHFTTSITDLENISFFVVTVPTPVNKNKLPNLTPLKKASETIGKVLNKDSVIVYESTVYPGVTEEICGPILAKFSGLKQGFDFKLGYSPERINPGDKKHTLAKIVKVVSGEDEETLERIAQVYDSIIDAGVYRATSIKVAETAKVLENTQRDLNIALMNELALICDRLEIRTTEVLNTAKTKWNFLPFTPGLVGGHCIGVDPYYLTTKAQELGYRPEVILAGRRINDSMGSYIGQKLVKLLVKTKSKIQGSKIGILGLTFKENVPDLRNSKVPDIIKELKQFGIEPLIHDPLANAEEATQEYKIKLTKWEELNNLNGLILAIPHQFYLDLSQDQLLNCLRSDGVFIDIKSVFNPVEIPQNLTYWSL